MGQVNVNEPGDPGPREGGYGAGMIIGVILAIILIVVLVWFLFLQQPGTQPSPGNGDEAPPPGDNGDDESPPPGGWRLVDRV
jgi:hypothetical protein